MTVMEWSVISDLNPVFWGVKIPKNITVKVASTMD